MFISSELRQELSSKFLGVDFTRYFEFIESLPLGRGCQHHILPQREFLNQSENPANLAQMTASNHFMAHYWLAICAPKCVSFQRTLFMMSTLRGFAADIAKEDLPRFADLYEKGQFLLAELRTPEHQRSAARAAGKHAVESGQFADFQAKGQKRLAEIGWREELGRRNVESGHIQRLGHDQGKRNVENGHLARLRTPEHQKSALHIRWHINRGIVAPGCPLCREQR